jgi:hypothetical protein
MIFIVFMYEMNFFCSLSIDVTEEGSFFNDDSEDEDYEPSLNFTLRFVTKF